MIVIIFFVVYFLALRSKNKLIRMIVPPLLLGLDVITPDELPLIDEAVELTMLVLSRVMETRLSKKQIEDNTKD